MAEKEYIEREAAIAMIRENGVHGSGWSDQEREDDVVDMIESIPAADVRPVVLCRDCKHWTRIKEDCILASCDLDALVRCEDFYCANGEKREES